MPQFHATDAPPGGFAAFVASAVAYFLAGMAALQLAIPPSFATPLFPAAGVALASVLVFGPRMLAAVAVGSFCLNVALGAQRGLSGVTAVVLPLCIALAATLQTAAGATLVRRWVRQPLLLSEPRDLARFLLACTLSCVVGSSLSSTALWLGGAVSTHALPFGLFTWWIGDLLGELIAAPIVLTLIGRPRDAWAPRRLAVGLTLSLVTLLLGLGIAQVARWNDERLRAAFERDASSASFALVAQLREPLQALEAIRGVYLASEDVTRAEMHTASEAWLRGGSLQALGWIERVRRADVPAFEAKVRAEGVPNFHVFDRADSPRPPGDEMMVIRYIEPAASNAPALGVNSLSVPVARAAIESTLASGKPAATAGFRLTQQKPGENEAGVVVYQAIRKGPDATPAQRDASLLGLVFVTLRMQAQLDALKGQIAPYLAMCIVDTLAEGASRRLAGPEGCEARPAGAFMHTRPLDYGGRRWELRASSTRGHAPGATGADAWLFSLVGLLSASVLGGFLLLVTGRTRRIESAVLERTAALEAEVREREVAEAALRESEQRFRNILNCVPIGVIYTDLRGEVIQTNPTFSRLIDHDESELLLLGPHARTHPADLAQDVELTGQLVRGEIPMYRRHKRYVARDGTTVWVRVTASLLRDPAGEPRRIVAVVEDITEHLRLEEAERAREAAEASNRAKSEFLSRMSHELRTPLNAMLGFAQLLELDERHPLAESQQPWVRQIQQAGWHLLEMINDVLDLSRIESGNLRLHTETLSLPELLTASLSMVDGEARRRRIEIVRDLAPDGLALRGDATRVKQILTNLLTNAVKYNADAGRIEIVSRVSGEQTVEIAVSDTGLGMTPSQMSELFQPFNRLGRERSGQEGTGIGLVISQRLAELMGGSLRARSVAGQGSTFILTLPLVADADTVRSDLDQLPSSPAEYHRRVVHYVEDNETNVEVMRGILAQRPQVRLEVSITGLDALAAIKMRRPDLVLLDMHLPDISGMELLRHLKGDPRTAMIPIVVVSADALAEQIAAATEAGASHYLTKPVSVSELLGLVDELLDRMHTRFGTSA